MKAAAIVDKDGLIIASKAVSEMDELSIGSVIEKLYDRIMLELKMGGRFGTTTFESEAGKLLFVNAGPTAILATLASGITDLDTILPYSLIAAEKIVQILEARKDVDVSIPRMAGEPIALKFKVAILGDVGVDKTSLLNKFVEKTFEQDYKSTIGTNIMSITYNVMENVTVGFALWDLASQPFFKKVRQMYLQNCHAALFVYDVTRPNTLYNLRNWKEELFSISGQDVKCLMIGIVNDPGEGRKVSFEEGMKVADELGFNYLETSTRSGDNLNRAFGALAFLLIKEQLTLPAPDRDRFQEQLISGRQTRFEVREIPHFRTIAQVNSENWDLRMKEEMEIIEYLWFYCHDLIIFKDIGPIAGNPRVFSCRAVVRLEGGEQQIDFKIRLPLHYPYDVPIAEGFSFGNYFQPADPYKNACLGALKDRWDKTGTMGIAHFLLLLSYYTALALFTTKLPDCS